MLRTKVLDVCDKGKSGTIVTLEHEIFEKAPSTGEECTYCKVTEMPFYLGQGDWGGPRGGNPPKFPPPDCPPPIILSHEVAKSAHLLYRLNGDYNPLHIDPKGAMDAGFDGVIMHGLYTWNVTCRLLLSELTDGTPTSLREFQARFSNPVRPGDRLTVEAWVVGKGSGSAGEKGWTEVRFQVRVNEDYLCLSHGRTLLRISKARLHSKI